MPELLQRPTLVVEDSDKRDPPPPRHDKEFSADVLRAISPLLTCLVAVGIWAAVTMPGQAPGSNLYQFNPASAFAALWRMVAGGAIWPDIALSLERLLAGLAIAAAAGIPLGCAVGLSRSADDATGPLFQFIRMISPVSWTPVAILLLGVGSGPAIALIAITAVWPMVISTSAGIRAVPGGWRLLASSLGATRPEIFLTVVLPAIRIPLLTGFRVALGIAWVVLVPVEMLGASRGLGYAIINAKDALAYNELMAVVLIIGALGFTLDTSLRRMSEIGTDAGTRRGGRRSSRLA